MTTAEEARRKILYAIKEKFISMNWAIMRIRNLIRFYIYLGKSIVRSNMDIKILYEKSRLSLIPPPPASLSKLTVEERKEITDYIFAKAEQVYDLTIKEAEKEVEKKNNARLSSKIVLDIIQYVLMFIIVVVFVYLIHRYVPHHILRNPY